MREDHNKKINIGHYFVEWLSKNIGKENIYIMRFSEIRVGISNTLLKVEDYPNPQEKQK